MGLEHRELNQRYKLESQLLLEVIEARALGEIAQREQNDQRAQDCQGKLSRPHKWAAEITHSGHCPVDLL